MTSESPRRFSLRRLFASVTCLAAAAGIVRFAVLEWQRYGTDYFTYLSAAALMGMLLAGIYLIFPKTATWLIRIVGEGLNWLLS